MHSSGDIQGGRSRPHTRHTRWLTAAVLGLSLAIAGGAEPVAAATTTEVTGRVSVTSAGAQVPVDADWGPPAVDATGRFVAFGSPGPLDPADTNSTSDVYVRDRVAGTTTRVSLTSDEAQLTGPSSLCGASADLRYIGFWSNAVNLPEGGVGQIYIRDRQNGSTDIVSVSSDGWSSSDPGAGSGVYAEQRCDISADGGEVVFTSEGINLVSGDTNGVADVFRRDRAAQTTTRISVKNDESQITGFESEDPQISDDGNLVVFQTKSVVVAGDGNGATDVFRRNVSSGTTTAVSAKPNGAGWGNGASHGAAISGDGTIVTFSSQATDLNASEPDANGAQNDVYLRPTAGGAIVRVSVSPTEVQGNALSYGSALSHDGRYVAFVSWASNLWLFDAEGSGNVFVRDRQLGTTSLADRRTESPVTSGYDTDGRPAISADGSVVGFGSVVPDLVRNDTNGKRDVFVRDWKLDHAPFASFDALVAQQFADFIGRAPTTQEKTLWRDRLRHGEVSPDEVIADLAHSTEWSQHRGPVARLYWSFFLRAPDKGGLDYWVAQKAGGKGLHTIAGQFAQSQEFKTLYGSLSNDAFVTLVYQNVLKRNPAPNEVAYWSGELAAKKTTRGSVMVGFSESAEGKRFLAPQVDVVLISVGMFGVIPPKATFTDLVTLLASGTPLEEIIELSRTTAEYAERVS